MESLFSYEILPLFITLTFLEIVLGIDNLIFIAIVVNDLPAKFKKKARIIGLSLAFLIRVLMLMALSWVMGMTKPLFQINGLNFSFNNILLIVGGLFLIIKSAVEIYQDIAQSVTEKHLRTKSTFFAAIMQIMVVDFIFSFDSIITAIGMTRNVPIIVAAVVIAMFVMFLASGKLSKFLEKYPSLKTLALAFIFMIGVILLTDGLHYHIPKGYLYFALFFSMIVEILNIITRNSISKKSKKKSI